MFISDAINKDELCSVVIGQLKEHGIKFRKEKKNKCSLEKYYKNIFGTPLSALELTDVVLATGAIVQIPKFVADACQRILEHVETEGLFRKAGSSSRQKEIRVGLEAGLPLGRSHHVVDVANVLKSFFRELPEPLIASSIQEPLLRSLLIGERGVKPLLMTCLLLPSLTVSTLAFFMQFLHTVSLSSHRNKMTVGNLAILFTPGLMPLADISGVRFTNHVKVVKLLIEQSKMIGVIPDTIAEQLVQKTAKTPSQGDKKKKKRRSGMFNGLRKIVGVIGSAESLDSTPENESATPCMNKSAKKRKLGDISAFSGKKKKDLLALFPENGGLLPNTPYSDKDLKKTRLSLGGRKVAKLMTDSSSSHASSVERRWSMVGPSWSRKKLSQTDFTKRNNQNPSLSPVISMPCLPRIGQPDDFTLEMGNGHGKELLPADGIIMASDYDFVRIPKNEYEAIKERVTAIETRISQEFGSVASCVLQTSTLDLDNSMSGPEKVLNKFEKTMEEAGHVVSPRTDQLAKRLSRELKIRRSEEHKIIRSPSARKIGTLRRRSRDSAKLARNKTWHLSNHYFLEVQSKENAEVTEIPFYPKSNLKRGRPNTVFTGLHQPSSVNKSEGEVNGHEISHVQEKWMSAEEFFREDDHSKGISTGGYNSRMERPNGDSNAIEFNTPAKRQISNEGLQGTHTPFYITSINLNEVKTPMLPPISTVKKSNSNKGQAKGTKAIGKNQTTQPEECLQGRASIARLRSQNAGMVMAKAKLFNELGSEVDKAKNPLPSSDKVRRSSAFLTKVNHSHSEANNYYLVPYKNLLTRISRDKMSDVSTGKSLRRKGTVKSPSNIQKRQAQKHEPPRQAARQSKPTMENIVTDIENVALIMNGPPKSDNSSTTDKLNATDGQLRNTPRIKKSLQVNSPRRIVKTPRSQQMRVAGGRRTPLKAKYSSLRSSPRLKLQLENKYLP